MASEAASTRPGNHPSRHWPLPQMIAGPFALVWIVFHGRTWKLIHDHRIRAA